MSMLRRGYGAVRNLRCKSGARFPPSTVVMAIVIIVLVIVLVIVVVIVINIVIIIVIKIVVIIVIVIVLHSNPAKIQSASHALSSGNGRHFCPWVTKESVAGLASAQTIRTAKDYEQHEKY